MSLLHLGTSRLSRAAVRAAALRWSKEEEEEAAAATRKMKKEAVKTNEEEEEGDETDLDDGAAVLERLGRVVSFVLRQEGQPV